MRRRNSILNNIAVIVLVAVLAAFMFLSYKMDQKEQQEALLTYKEQMEERHAVEADYMITVLANERTAGIDEFVSSAQVVSKAATGEILLTAEQFSSGVDLRTGYKSNAIAKYTLNRSIAASDIVVLEFLAYTEGGIAEFTVKCGGVSNNVTITKIPTMFYIPISGVSSLDELYFKMNSEFVNTTIDEVCLVNYGTSYSINELKTGAYADSEYSKINIDYSDKILEKCTQFLKDGEYYYTLQSGKLTAYMRNNDGSFNEISSVSDMGTTRDMEFSKDKSAIIVTARQNGVYIIDITDPSNLIKLSHYDTLVY